MTEAETIIELRNEVSEIKTSLTDLIKLVKQMNFGLYGDEVNDHPGLIKKQRLLEDDFNKRHGELEKEVEVLKSMITEFKNKIDDKDIAESTKDKVNGTWVYWGKKAIEIAIQVIVIYAVLKGIVGVDTLLK